jgi:hypothetical protein
MFANFLPSSVIDIQDLEAIALLQQLHRQMIQVPFEQGTAAIATAYCRFPDQSAWRCQINLDSASQAQFSLEMVDDLD